MGAIDESKLNNILPKYDELKLSGKNLAQQYVSAFNTGMNIYQCINQLQGYIDWIVKAVNDVVVQWNEILGSHIENSINATKQATTEQFNIEWDKNKAQLDTEIEGIIQKQFNNDWKEKENAINDKINVVSNDLTKFKTETNTKFTSTKEELTTTKKELTNLINTTIDNTINKTIDNTINYIYPIGSVYISLTNTNPGTYLKGTWEQFAQGRTLIGVGDGNDGVTSMTFKANATGGEYKHILTVEEMPTHTHKFRYRGGQGVQTSEPFGDNKPILQGANDYGPNVDNTGGGVSHNNIQPYVAVYFWKRVK